MLHCVAVSRVVIRNVKECVGLDIGGLEQSFWTHGARLKVIEVRGWSMEKLFIFSC